MKVFCRRDTRAFPKQTTISARRMLAAAIASGALLGGSAFAESSASVYGLLDVGMTYNNRVLTAGTATSSRVSMDSGNLQGSRLGFRGTEDLGNGLAVLFVIENGFALDTGAAAQGGLLFGRTAVVGFSGGFGRVTIGRQTDFIYTDLAFYNSIIPMANLVLNAHALNLDRSEGSRVNNSIRYNTPTAGGFSGSAIYGLGEQAGNSSAGRSFGLGAKYENGPFKIGAAYFQSAAAAAGGAPVVTPSSDAGTACVNVNGKAGDTCLKTFMLASTYRVARARLYASWSRVELPLTVAGGVRRLAGPSNDKMDVYDIGMAYDLTGQLALLTSVVQNRAAFKGSNGGGRVGQLNLGLDYVMSKRTDIYTWIGSQRTSDMLAPGIYGAPGADNSQTVFQLGIRHTF
jgi:predicted porin